jgi:hypothetical protein
MFARFLELEASEFNINRYFLYEPDFLKDGSGWVPDFHVADMTICNNGRPKMIEKIIEYKPSRPTDTCVCEFFKRCQNVAPGLIHRLYFGSVFSGESDVYGSPKELIGYEWARLFSNEIKSTRFDLEVL